MSHQTRVWFPTLQTASHPLRMALKCLKPCHIQRGWCINLRDNVTRDQGGVLTFGHSITSIEDGMISLKTTSHPTWMASQPLRQSHTRPRWCPNFWRRHHIEDGLITETMSHPIMWMATQPQRQSHTRPGWCPNFWRQHHIIEDGIIAFETMSHPTWMVSQSLRQSHIRPGCYRT